MQLLYNGLQLMVLGMGAVFVFLVLMIFCMKLMEIALRPFAGMLEPAPKPAARPKVASGSNDDAQLAAIAVAAVEAARK